MAHPLPRIFIVILRIIFFSFKYGRIKGVELRPRSFFLKNSYNKKLPQLPRTSFIDSK